jgi:hypothetical protein
MSEPRFEFVEVTEPGGTTVIEVRERATGRLHTTIEPDLFAYMLEKAWNEAADGTMLPDMDLDAFLEMMAGPSAKGQEEPD